MKLEDIKLDLKTVAAVIGVAVAGAGAWYGIDSRVGDVEKVVKTINETVIPALQAKVDKTSNTVIEIRAHQRDSGEQLNRIETLVRAQGEKGANR